VEVTAIALAYFVVAKGSLAFASLNPSATPVWPATGLAIAVTLLRGYRVLPAILIGAFLANVATTGGMTIPAVIAAGNTLEALVGAYLINRWVGGTEAFRSPYGIGQFAFILIAAATPISATVGVVALEIGGEAPWSSFWAIWATWWLGDAVGAIMVTPALVLWGSEWRRPAAVAYESVVLHLFALGVGAVAFGPFVPSGPGRNALAFLAVLPVLWAALRRGPRDTSTVALLLSVFAVWGVAAGESPFAQATLNASFLLLGAFVASVTLPSLALSAAVASRDRTLVEYDLAARAGGIGIWDWDLRTNTMNYSDQAKAIFGFPPDAPVTYEKVRDATHPEDLPNTSALARRALDPRIREKHPYEYRIVRSDGAERWLLAHGHAVFEGENAVRYIGTIQDITERKLLGQALAASDARLKLALHAGRLAVWEYRGATGEIIGSPELNELLGFPRDRPVRSDEYRERYAPGERERLQAIGLAALQSGARSLNAEARFVLPDGRTRWLLLRADFIGGGEAPDCLGVAVDITPQKKAEEHLQLLVGELNHRVKNMLAIVQAIVVPALRGHAPKGAVNAVEGRLQALARAHDILTSAAWEGADLRSVILESVTPHIGSNEARLRLSGPAVSLPARLAVPISMVLHELATNALKYGSLSRDGGTVEISWNLDPDAEGNRLVVRWRERGGPAVGTPATTGFGMRMVERSIASERGGDLRMEFEAAGLTCVFQLVLPDPTS
jgi:PAS domain S-box-containing protein